jgi:hypothetical protein
MRLCVLHRATGVCLYEKIWKWRKGTVRSDVDTAGVCNLSLSLLALAGSLNRPSETKYVIFDQPKKIGEERESGRLKHASVAKSSFPSAKQHSIRLVFLQRETLLLSLFHDAACPWDQMDEYINKVLTEFLSLHWKTVEEIQSNFELMVGESYSGSVTQESVLQTFRSFDKVIRTIEPLHTQ